jgi:predicted AAA+ superfamily ATPase
MNYMPRHHEHKLARYADLFPVQLVVGARQVGKSTILRHLFEARAKCHTFDPLIDIAGALGSYL